MAEALKATFDSSANLLGAQRTYFGAWTGSGGSLLVPWQNVPRSLINTKVDGARRFVAQSWPFAHICAVGKALDGTFNDAVLAMCAGGPVQLPQELRRIPPGVAEVEAAGYHSPQVFLSTTRLVTPRDRLDFVQAG
ncbi:wax ester/triacylglycerol synthase domain-containing protein [Seongchinamella unica]|uniref:wax ester/triacylglycerol synthase domain-containing protein n=1 Tax=Seongchinamella unica TaxID=2547392 RepID=UPI001404C8F7|nr:wax ester/triacylglycerol synthase domain-containing protein [Seongchinamella unica]